MQSVLTEKLAEVRSDLMKLPLLLAADPHSDLLRMIEELSSNIQDQVGWGQRPAGTEQHLQHPWQLVQRDGSLQCLTSAYNVSQQDANLPCTSSCSNSEAAMQP
jgi:hypothetical protein